MEVNVEQSRLFDDQELAAQAKKEATVISSTLGPMLFPTLSGVGSGLATQASPQLGGRMNGLSTPRVSPLPAVGRGTMAYFAGRIMGRADSTPLPSPRVGAERSHVFLTRPIPPV